MKTMPEWAKSDIRMVVEECFEQETYPPDGYHFDAMVERVVSILERAGAVKIACKTP